ncbi:MAG TPA: phosphatidylglycerol lysyltransferase domain-containing protein [Streptosporangiaceae bacterium]|nr:phosphatidylglycerol lysyltransferase domain-containing protein [Streptosporangiaceae bacterium]
MPRLAGWIVLLVGVSFIALGVNSGLYQQLHHAQSRIHRVALTTPGALTLTFNLTRTALIVIGLLLLMLCHGLFRRKHRSWQAVMTLLILAAVVNVIRVRHLINMFGLSGMCIGFAITAVLIGLGFYYHREFYALGDPRTRWRALGVFVRILVADLAIGLSYIAVRGLTGPYTVPERVAAVFYGLVGASPPTPIHFAEDIKGDFFVILTGGLGLITVIMTAYLFLRPAEPQGRLGAADAERIRSLLDRYGDADSLGYFALRDDKSVIWSATGKSCICYRVQSGVMLASADPLGDPEAWPGAIHEFLDMAARHAWVPAVVGCSELGAEVWVRTGGLTALELGDEAVVRVADFSLQGRAMRNVRQMVTRVCRAGYIAEVRRVGDVPPDELAWMTRQADSWRGTPTERGFSMALGRIGGPGDENCMVATATQDGVLKALLHFVPWGSDGLSLDLMRRDRSAQPGLNDFMIVETIKAAQDLGVKRISLNFAAFRSALERGERIGAGPITRAWRRFLIFLSQWFQIESLYKFNAKFAPMWVPRFIVFTGPGDAIRVGLAALEAEALLVWPTMELSRIRRKLTGALRTRKPAPVSATTSSADQRS